MVGKLGSYKGGGGEAVKSYCCWLQRNVLLLLNIAIERNPPLAYNNTYTLPQKNYASGVAMCIKHASTFNGDRENLD